MRTRFDLLPDIKLDNRIIEYKHNAKYLGIFFYKRLKWKEHIRMVTTKSHKRLGLIQYIRDNNETIKTNHLITLYKSIVRQVIEYAAEVWGDASVYLKIQLDSIQQKSLIKASGVA